MLWQAHSAPLNRSAHNAVHAGCAQSYLRSWLGPHLCSSAALRACSFSTRLLTGASTGSKPLPIQSLDAASAKAFAAGALHRRAEQWAVG